MKQATKAIVRALDAAMLIQTSLIVAQGALKAPPASQVGSHSTVSVARLLDAVLLPLPVRYGHGQGQRLPWHLDDSYPQD
jgi:hypothetical protein